MRIYSRGCSRNPREVLLRVRKVVEALRDGRVKHSYYLKFYRRLQFEWHTCGAS